MSRHLAWRHAAMRLKEPFRISGYTFEAFPAIVAEISDGVHTGRGEAAGVYYMGDDAARMEREIESGRAAIEAGLDRAGLRALLPPGGARNALDCALWELESLQRGVPVAALAGVAPTRALITTFTIAADDPPTVRRKLQAFGDAQAIKIKLDGRLEADIERVRTVREARPDVWIGVDANQGYARADLDALAPALVEARVSLIEQPVARGAEASLDGWHSPIPVAADESILDLRELALHHHRFDVINIKLDKCGGLTEALMMAREAKALGKQVMVGNMAGSALGTAPGFVLAQLCDIVDLDGPWFLADDPLGAGLFADGRIMVPAGLWGAG